ncbi:MAG: tRNA uridine-5-carboxymethylaminomethyl(34) synthesis GTPase MnmE [Lachnospiraceae bacterium]|nr:tRNA uridine-5-carboxymethylaminomethyl(34) synthesis GTPase MnmE [Lachnospiraceae bacterium]
MFDTTIAAIATSLGPSGVGKVRISGAESFSIISKIAFNNKREALFVKEMESHTIHHGYIYDDDVVIDEVLILLMKAPRTFTGEDTVEIDCHGGVMVMQKILETVIKNGATLAEPGEFSKRAFLNGKMDLTKAESVIDLINSSNKFAMDNSIKHLTGKLFDKITVLRKALLHEIAYIEAALDDPEHYDLTGYEGELRDKLLKIKEDIDVLINTSDNGRILKEGINVAIVGEPNVGKSTLLNAISGYDAAIVTDIAGTTRDVITEHVMFGNISLNIMDTAGIRETTDPIELIGVNRTLKAVKDADLVLFMLDSTTPINDYEDEIYDLVKEKQVIMLLNKIDRSTVVTEGEYVERYNLPIISVSAKEGSGVELLQQKISDMFFNGEVTFNNEVYVTGVRQKQCLIEASNSIANVLHSIDDHMPEDFFSIDIMAAYAALGRMIGEEVGDDLVNEIFSKFCMGK